MTHMARRPIRHDGHGTKNGAEVADAAAPFVRESRSVVERTETQIAQGHVRRRDSEAFASNAPCVFVGNVYREI